MWSCSTSITVLILIKSPFVSFSLLDCDTKNTCSGLLIPHDTPLAGAGRVVRTQDNCDNNQSWMIYSVVKQMGICSISRRPVETGLIKLDKARSPKLKFWLCGFNRVMDHWNRALLLCGLKSPFILTDACFFSPAPPPQSSGNIASCIKLKLNDKDQVLIQHLRFRGW